MVTGQLSVARRQLGPDLPGGGRGGRLVHALLAQLGLALPRRQLIRFLGYRRVVQLLGGVGVAQFLLAFSCCMII